MKHPSIPYWVMLAGSLITVLIIFWPAVDSLDGSMGAASGLIYQGFSKLCHQQPERSFHLAGAQLPVCVRCLGVYLGAFSGLLLWGLFKGTASKEIPSRNFILLGFAPLVVDGLLNLAGLVHSPESVRMITGLLAGGAASALLAPALASMEPPIPEQAELSLYKGPR